jgi:hypothetical protein
VEVNEQKLVEVKMEVNGRCPWKKDVPAKHYSCAKHITPCRKRLNSLHEVHYSLAISDNSLYYKQ